MPGVVEYVDYTDVPGLNVTSGSAEGTEPIFSEGAVGYAGQALGLVLADTAGHARNAAAAVSVTYANEQPPLLTIRDAKRTLTGQKPRLQVPKRPIVPGQKRGWSWL